MFFPSDFIRRSRRLQVLGEGTFGAVGLYQTPDGLYVIKETKISEDSLGYPPDFINEVDMLMKLRDVGTVVALQGVCFEDEKRKGYILLEPMETNLSRWYKRTPFEVRISHLGTLISSIGGALSIMHRLGMIHNDIKANNILLNNTSNGPFFKLADFGKAKCGYTGSYGAIERYQPPFKMDLYNAEFWAFMVTLVEVIIGKRIFEGDSKSKFYKHHLKMRSDGVRFDLQGFLQRELRRDQFQMIPQFFWDLVTPLLTNQTTDLTSSLQRIGIEVNKSCLEGVEKTVARAGPIHPSYRLIEREFKRRFDDLDLIKHHHRFQALMNKFLHAAGIELNEVDLKHYGEVAMTMITKRKVDYLKYFQDQDTFLLYQRAFFTLMGYQVHVL